MRLQDLSVIHSVKAVTLGGLEETASKAGIAQSPASPDAVAGVVVGQVISLVGIIFLVLMIYGGAMWMTAGGDEKKIDKARSIIGAALIGLLIVVGAYAITQFVGQSIMGNTPNP